MVTGVRHQVVRPTCTASAPSVLACSPRECSCTIERVEVEASPNCSNGRQQDTSRGTRRGVRVCLHVISNGTHALFQRAYDLRNGASATPSVRAVYA